MKTDYIPTLDGWRAVAILAVMASHAALPFAAAHPWLRFAEQGAAGVDIFFALSGFLICSRLLAEHERAGRVDWKGFYRRRAFRILPPYLAYLGVLGVLAGAGVVVVAGADWASCLLFCRNYLGKVYWSWETGHFWSLAVEEHFYLLFPLLFAVLGPKRLRWAAPWLLLLLEAWRMADHRFHWFDAMLPGTVTPYRSDVRISGIAFGCWAALLLQVPRVRAFATRYASDAVTLALAMGVLGCLYFYPPLFVLWQRVLVAALVVSTTLGGGKLSARLLEAAPLRWIGRLSYSLYIWQQLFLTPTAGHPWQLFPLNVVLAFGAAWVSYRWIEMPLMAFGKRFGRAAKKPRAVSLGATESVPA